MKREQRRRLDKMAGKLPVSEDLVAAMSRMDQAQRDMVGEMVLHYDDMVSKNRNEADGSIAWGMHDAADRAIKNNLATNPHGSEVKCAKGCSACCHVHVHVSVGEAQLLLHHAHETGVYPALDRLVAQQGKRFKDWYSIPHDKRACVWLDEEGACKVYEHRPTACRKMQVITDPELCDIEKNPGAKVGRLGTVEAEVIFAVMLMRQKNGSMADMLLEAMKDD